MLERIVFKEEEGTQVFRLLFTTFAITVAVGLLNIFLGNNSLFYVALISLVLSYPTVNYIRSMDKDEIEQRMYARTLIVRHGQEMLVFWSIFVGITIGMFCIALVTPVDFYYQQAFVNGLSGHITQPDKPFSDILFNNLVVGLLTFIVSFVVFSGLIFVLAWNASILAYYLSTLSSGAVGTGFSLLGHGLLEVGGYTLIGIAGSIVAYKLDRVLEHRHDVNSAFYKDLAILLVCGFALILIAATIEIL